MPRGRGRRQQGSRKTERPQKTVEDLDAEMEVCVIGKSCPSCTDQTFQDYTTSSAAPAAVAATAA